MAFSFNYHQRQGFVGVMNALQRLEEDPGRLSLERARYDDPPPPYPSSGETTQPASPAEAHVTDEAALQARRNLMLRSMPYAQFDSQTRRERERIVYQRGEERYGRRRTLPYDETADLLANSQNNIRARWVEQGIWKEEWGPAWPKGAKPWDNRWRSSRENTGGPRPFGRWLHEKRPDPKLPSPEPAPEPETKAIRNIFVGLGREEPNATTEEPGHASAPDVTEAPAATSERDTSASRPYQQFLFQVSKEREWVRDELQFKRSAGTIDIDAMAYESTKKNWIEDEIWNPAWGELPGTTWMHEDLEEEDERRTSIPQPDAVSNDEQPPRLPSPRSFNSEPTPGVYNDGTSSNNLSTVPEEVDASSGVIARARGKRKRAKGTSRLPTVKESPRSAEESAGRALRSVRSSKVMKPSESESTVSNTRFRKKNYRMFGPGEISNLIRQNSTSHTPGGDDTIVAPGNEQFSTKRPIRTCRRSSLGLAGSGMSKPKSRIEHQRQPDARTKNATLQLPSAGALNNTRQRRRTVENQPIATKVPRRSKRIAAQMRNIPVERERKTAASGEAKGRSRSSPHATSISADSNRIRKRQCSSNGGTQARRQSRS
ncbi:uncharacterized protein EI97DRAFT_431207 [Westerdykella ornata]|uniref:Uncharacterized protein n=1 Tax=Westerdykella ornata TaxID=318751 RepID=A0A6A6JQR9_WESOR|nr:uncharacterized protein EI97DRAFT_431207 [Westerdykella ornata]KAF2278990.1 hypothetical protein EI97DRAFT_431207 [Westerdykella ornata]